MYIAKNTGNMPSHMSPIRQRSHNNSCTWQHDARKLLYFLFCFPTSTKEDLCIS